MVPLAELEAKGDAVGGAEAEMVDEARDVKEGGLDMDAKDVPLPRPLGVCPTLPLVRGVRVRGEVPEAAMEAVP